MEQASEKLKTYFALMQKSIALMTSMDKALDALYKASLQMDFELTQSANENVMKLSSEIAGVHDLRQQIASEFGCQGEQFSFELAKKLPPKIGKQLRKSSTELMHKMELCQIKLNSHSEQLQRQKQIVNEAVESLNLTVTA